MKATNTVPHVTEFHGGPYDGLRLMSERGDFPPDYVILPDRGDGSGGLTTHEDGSVILTVGNDHPDHTYRLAAMEREDGSILSHYLPEAEWKDLYGIGQHD